MARGTAASHMKAAARSVIEMLGESGVVYIPRGVAAHKRTVNAIVKRTSSSSESDRSGRSLVYRVTLEAHATRGTLSSHEKDELLVPELEGGTETIRLRRHKLVSAANGLVKAEYIGVIR